MEDHVAEEVVERQEVDQEDHGDNVHVHVNLACLVRHTSIHVWRDVFHAVQGLCVN